MSASAPPGYGREEWSHAWIERRAALTPHAPALLLDGRRIEYAELAAGARRAARALRSLAAREGSVVALLLESDLALVELIHAAGACGVVLALLNLRLSPSELAYQLRDCGAELLIHGGGNISEKAREACEGTSDIRRLELGAGLTLDRHPEVSDRTTEPDAPACARGRIDLERPFVILYTSGTSGVPKGVTLGQASFLASAAGSAELLGTGSDDCWLLCLPVFHVGGLSILLRAVLAGSCVVLHRRFDAEAVSRDLDAHPVTGISLVANTLQRVLDARGERPPPQRLRVVLLGGGPAPDALLARARQAGFPIALTYGLTEAASQVATRLPNAPPDAGLPLLPGVDVRVVGEDGTGLPSGGAGEIQVRGPVVMLGYWGRPQETADTLMEGWLRTGDVGHSNSDGSLWVHARRSDLIVSGGENVYPAEIEAALCRHPSVAEAGVSGRPDESFGARPVAWVVARPGATLEPDALEAHCRDELAAYKVPVRIHLCDTLPRGASGKLIRRSLREPDE